MSMINPRVDIAFKKIFGTEENKDLLLSLVNSILSPQDQVAELELLNPYNAQNFRNNKLSILDIKAKSLDGRLFNIEMQVADEADYDKRALYYWARLYTDQLKSGDSYSELAKAIGIHILNFTSITETKKYHNVFHLLEKDDQIHYFKDIELHTIELNKFTGDKTLALNDLVAKIQSSLDIWLAFLTRHVLLEQSQLPESLNQPYLKKALQVLNVMNFTAEERLAYEGRLDWLRLEESALQKRWQDGKAEGLAEGKVAGMSEGKALGLLEGELKTKTILVLNMHHNGIAISDIAKISGLNIEEIRQILAAT